jgi:hypothetical protein
VRVPDEAGIGVAKVTLSLDDWKEGHVPPAHAEVRVVDAEFKEGTKR